MSEFDVNFDKLLLDLARVQSTSSEIGASFDKLEAKLGRASTGMAKALKALDDSYDKVSKSVKGLGGDTTAMEARLLESHNTIKGSLAGMVTSAAQAEIKYRALRGEYGELGKAFSNTQAFNIAANAMMKIQNLTNELIAKSEVLRARRTSLSTAEGKLAADLQVQLAAYTRIATAEERQRMKAMELTKAYELQASARGKNIATLEAQTAALRAEQQETAKQAAELARLERQEKSLNGGKAESLVRQAELNRQRKAAIVESMRAANSSKNLQQANKKETESSTALTRAQQALTKEREHAANTLARLRAQATLLNGSYGVQRAALESQIRSQREYNKLLAMSTSELLGFSKVKRTFIGNFNSANQAGAILRATMGGLRANIGMYTSSTILAASATYAIARAIRSSLEVGVEYEYTMARVKAIMTGSMSDSTALASMEAMNAQVRSLGQTTMFTAAEVSEGLQELGMAGLSAAEAMVSLQPALDLAMIGNIGMGEAADIATNVMMTFGLEAKDLSGVVDLLASSVTSSNTTISQLANALSYVGPAAEAAGFSIEDTVAAISTLANVGVKGSRAGTGLRRMMANLLNPTAKGAAVMRQYGISVDDAAGNTRNFQDILKQLNETLYSGTITEAERLAAIIDLVGVRAASAASALIEQSGGAGVFTTMRRQFEEVEGAAKRMRETIQDTMRMDFRNILSSFQEVQLTAMDSQAERLSLAAVKITSALVGLTEQAEGFDKGISKLDVFLVRVERVAEALFYLGSGYVAFKFAAGGVSTLFSAAANTTSLWSDRLTIASGNLSKTTVANNGLTTSIGKQTMALMTNQAAQTKANTAMAVGAGYASSFASGISKASAFVSVATRLMGWAGLIYGIGTAIHSVFSGSAKEDLAQHKEDLKGVVGEYEDLKEAIELAAYERTRSATEKLVERLEESLLASEEKIKEIREVMARSEELGVDTSNSTGHSLISQLGSQRVGELKQLASAEEVLVKMGESSARVLILRKDALEVQRALNKALEDQIKAEAKMAESYPDGPTGLTESTAGEYYLLEMTLNRLKKEIPALHEALERTQKKITATATREVTAFEQIGRQYQAFVEGDLKDFLLSQGSAADRAAEAQRAYNESLAEYETKAEDMRAAIEANNNDLASQNALMAAGEERNRAYLVFYKAHVAAIKEREAAESSLSDVREQYLRSQMTETELTEHLRAKLAEVTDEMARRAVMGSAASDASLEDLKEETELLTKYLALSRELSGLEGKRPTRDTAAEELERAISQAETTYQSLLQSIDPVGASLLDVSEKQEQLNLLLEHGKTATDGMGISQDQYRRGLFELQKAHVEVELAQDKNLEALYALQQEYSKSPFESTIEDMLELQRLYDEGAVSMDRYMQLSQQMKAKANADAISGAPTTSFQMQGAASTPFTELGSTMIGIAEGNSWYDKRGQELVQGQNMSGQMAIDTFDMEVEELRNRHARMMELNRENQEAQLALTKEYDAKVLAAEDRKNDAIRESQDQLNRQSAALTDDRKRYEEESSKLMMVSMLGTAESILGMFAAVGEDATTSQKVAFAAQKALAVAQILLYTHIAAAKANSELPVFAGQTMSGLILAQGYASAGLVGALAIGELAGGGGGSSYAGAYDKGGWIPAGKWGVVGEYGPEMVHGPANVTGREKTSKMLGGGGDEFNITLAPVINVESSGNGDGSNSEEEGKLLGNTLKLAVLSTMQEQMRPNGMLDTWVRSARRG